MATDSLPPVFLSILILGGAALQRCDNYRVFNGGFSRWGEVAAALLEP
jgi:hypothetical protein